jgi:hypothetical protein
VAQPDFYAQDGEEVQQALRELKESESLLEQKIERWGELETLQSSLRPG